jgi:hypothetical protein
VKVGEGEDESGMKVKERKSGKEKGWGGGKAVARTKEMQSRRENVGAVTKAMERRKKRGGKTKGTGLVEKAMQVCACEEKEIGTAVKKGSGSGGKAWVRWCDEGKRAS